MSNWVTLPNGVHIDLDDPNNPVTGSGSFADLGKGGNSAPKGVKESQVKELNKMKEKLKAGKITESQYNGFIDAALTINKGQMTPETEAWLKSEKINAGKSSQPKEGTKAYAMNSLKDAMNKYTMDENDCQNMLDSISSNAAMKKQTLDAIDKDFEEQKQWANSNFKNTREGIKQKAKYVAMLEEDASYQRNAVNSGDWSTLDYADTLVRDRLIDIVRNTFNLKRPKK